MGQGWKELLMRDHEITERMLAALEKAFASPQGPAPELLLKARDYVRDYVDACHNQKEEQHLFPRLEQRGLSRESGPLAVMLAEHEQGRSIIARLSPLCDVYAAGDRSQLAAAREAFAAYAGLVKDHFWKETDILFPMGENVLDEADAAAVVAGIAEIEAAAGPQTRERYYRLADEIVAAVGLEDLSFGLEREVLAAILNTLPVELSFVDAGDTVRYFSHEHAEKIFPRTRGVIGNKVQNCHPEKSVHLVSRILADFKAGKREVAEFWIEMGPRFVHIRYWPVRDRAGRYLGCLETAQDAAPIRALRGQKRLLDEG